MLDILGVQFAPDRLLRSTGIIMCHAAPSHTRRISSFEYAFESSSRKAFMQSVLQYGNTRKNPSPVLGSTAPYAYRYSRIWWHGTDGRFPFLHQQYLGLLIRPNPASSWNINRTFPFVYCIQCSSTVCLIFLRPL